VRPASPARSPELIWSVPEIIYRPVRSTWTIEPGDIIYTGTPPRAWAPWSAATGWRPTSRVLPELRIEGIAMTPAGRPRRRAEDARPRDGRSLGP